jgi:hypothetical protein
MVRTVELLQKTTKEKEKASKVPPPKMINPHAEADLKEYIDKTKGMLDGAASSASSFGTKIRTDVGGAFAGLSQDIANNFGKLGVGGELGKSTGIIGSFIGLAVGVGAAMSAIFDMFENDTRSSFTRLTDDLAALDQKISDLEDRMDRLKKHDVAGKAGLEGLVDTTGGIAGDLSGSLLSLLESESGREGEIGVIAMGSGSNTREARQGRLKEVLDKWLNRGQLGWRITDAGDFVVTFDGNEIAGYSFYFQRWEVVNPIGVFKTDAEVILICNYILAYAKANGMNASSLGVADTDRAKADATSSSSASASRVPNLYTSGKNYMGSGGMGSMGGSTNVNINISAIDEHGVQQFVQNKLAPMMVYLSGRRGTVFLNKRGVSGNA